MDVPCVARPSSFCMPPLPLPIEAYPASLVPCLFHHIVAQEYYISVACCSSLSIRVSLLVSAAWSHLSGAQENSAKMESKSLIHGNGSPRVMAKGSVGGGDIDEFLFEFSPRALCSTSGRSQNGCWAVVKMVSWLPNGWSLHCHRQVNWFAAPGSSMLWVMVHWIHPQVPIPLLIQIYGVNCYYTIYDIMCLLGRSQIIGCPKS